MPQVVRLVIEKGSSASFSVAITGMDLTSESTASMGIKQTSVSSEAIDTLTTDNGRITISANTLCFTFPTEVTSVYPEGNLYYTIQCTSTSESTVQLLCGELYVVPSAT